MQGSQASQSRSKNIYLKKKNTFLPPSKSLLRVQIKRLHAQSSLKESSEPKFCKKRSWHKLKQHFFCPLTGLLSRYLQRSLCRMQGVSNSVTQCDQVSGASSSLAFFETSTKFPIPCNTAMDLSASGNNRGHYDQKQKLDHNLYYYLNHQVQFGCCHIQHHAQTIHPTEIFILMNLLQMSCVIT